MFINVTISRFDSSARAERTLFDVHNLRLNLCKVGVIL